MNVERKVLTCDGSGAASGSITVDVPGIVHAVKLDYSAGMAATCDVTITNEVGSQVVSQANSATDKVHYPRLPATKPDGTASTLTEVPAVARRLTVAVAQGTPTETVAVTAFVLTG